MQTDQRIDEIEVLNGTPFGDDDPAIEEYSGQVWVRDPWEGRLHPAQAIVTTPGGIRIAEAIYEGTFNDRLELTRVLLIAIVVIDPGHFQPGE